MSFNELNNLAYHKPDDRWEIFGIPDFDTYNQNLVIKGLFHPSVPKDVVEAFLVAEYMMSHAYYHYPLYEEAFSKLLRITEMAIKLRCNELGIELKNANSRFNKTLSVLIKELCLAEPGKDLEHGLDIIRNIRNSMMHPERHSYSGAMCKGAIQSTVTLLNEIFIPGPIFTPFLNHHQAIKEQLFTYQKGLFVLEFQDNRYLVESVEVAAAILADGKWIYYLVACPVTLNIGEQMTKHSYSKPLLYFVTDLSIGENELIAKEMENSSWIKINTTNHPDNLVTYQKFIAEREEAEENDRVMYDHFMKDTIAKKENEFWYMWLWRIE